MRKKAQVQLQTKWTGRSRRERMAYERYVSFADRGFMRFYLA